MNDQEIIVLATAVSNFVVCFAAMALPFAGPRKGGISRKQVSRISESQALLKNEYICILCN